MKHYLSILALFVVLQPANAQEGTAQDTTQKKNCFEEYIKAFTERRALPVPDGEHNVVYSARKDTICFCGEAKAVVKDGLIVPSITLVKKKDDTFEQTRKELHPKLTEGELASTHRMHVENGMSETLLTEDEFLINLFFIDFLKRKVVPNKPAPHPDDIEGVQIELNPEEKKIIQQAYEGLKFQNGKDAILSSSYPTLKLMAGMLADKPEYKLILNGYTDNVGSAESNLKLSQRRAESVKNYLVSQGVDASRITTNGFGIENPIADNKTAEGRAQNRRVDFIVEQ